jgi:hypothetical protein
MLEEISQMSIGSKYITVLADGIQTYYSEEDLRQVCEEFSVNLSYDDVTENPAYMRLARSVIGKVEHGNNRRFLESIISSLVSRARKGVAQTDWERRAHHQGMLGLLEGLEGEIQKAGLPNEISVPESQPFTAKSEAREFLALAETEVTVVDNWVGPSTLDCLRDVRQPIRLLTANLTQGFDRVLRDFRVEGKSIEVRIHPRLHDRYILFNDRCWLAGSSLKDAGKKVFNIIEAIDIKSSIRADVEMKWGDASISR